MARADVFTTVRSEGALLPADFLQKLVEPRSTVEGLAAADYHLAGGEKPTEAASRAWNHLLGIWAAFQTASADLKPGERATTLTREKWLLPLFQELGYGRLQTARAFEIEGKPYPISHIWQQTPIHLIGRDVDLDRRTPGVAGAARTSPHGLLQEFLNRSEGHLWGFVSNGLKLRVLHDNRTFTRQAYVEFDLAAMMEGQVFADFVLLWLVCHQSRVEGERAEQCWLEKWAESARKGGTRALDDLRDGVQRAIEALGRGFLKHVGNAALKERLTSGALDKQEYYRQLLREVYRLIFLFVAEDRDLLLIPNASPTARERYAKFYSIARLRTLAERRRGTQHDDLWRAMSLVFQKLSSTLGSPELGVPALGSFLWSEKGTPQLDPCAIANADLLDAVRALAFTTERGVRRAVDYRNLGPEELGSVYESLLELHPDLNADAGTFELKTAAGHERKTTGSYYTPTSLIERLLDSALDPVLDQAVQKPDPATAILSLKVCDPACGSGHFLIAAAHRIASRLASVRTGDEEPSPAAVRSALRDVVGHCIYGVDVNPMAVELCKINLWLEAIEPGKPLSFLDHHIQCGNSLLGATPALLAKGIPDDAFDPLEGDDKEFCKELRRRNKREREGFRPLPFDHPWDRLGDLASGLANIDSVGDDTLEGLLEKERRWQEHLNAAGYEFSRLWADAWCASFVWRKTPDQDPRPIGEDVFRTIERNPNAVSKALRDHVRRLAAQFSFFHWHIAFPAVFDVPHTADPSTENAGWLGGFDLVLGNPPWEAEELVEKEYFATVAPQIASIRTKAKRAALIESLRTEAPELFATWEATKRLFQGRIHFCKSSGYFPLGSRGKLNTYRLFAELSARIVSVGGRIGQVQKSGIITAQDSQPLFSEWLKTGRVLSAYDFINIKSIFPEVVANERFCLLTLSGRSGTKRRATFAFTLTDPLELSDPHRLFEADANDLATINADDFSVPPASSRRAYELLMKMHAIAGSLRIDRVESNPWDTQYTQGHLNSASDSELFADLTFEQLAESGAELMPGEILAVNGQSYVPLYEGKYIAQQNHRFATFEGVSVRDRFGVKAEAVRVSQDQLGNPAFEVRPRYWLNSADAEVAYAAKRTEHAWLFVFRDVCRAIVDARTVQACVMPKRPCLDGVPILRFDGSDPARAALLFNALWTTFVFDFAARQKIHGAHLTKAIAYQLPVPAPSKWTSTIPGCEDVIAFTLPRALELTVVSHSLVPIGHEVAAIRAPFRWDDRRRFLLRCELDALFFHMYQFTRDDVTYVMDTFPIVRRSDEAAYGEYRTRRVILEIYDAMQDAARTGTPFQSLIDPPPADSRVAHPPSESIASEIA